MESMKNKYGILASLFILLFGTGFMMGVYYISDVNEFGFYDMTNLKTHLLASFGVGILPILGLMIHNKYFSK